MMSPSPTSHTPSFHSAPISSSSRHFPGTLKVHPGTLFFLLHICVHVCMRMGVVDEGHGEEGHGGGLGRRGMGRRV